MVESRRLRSFARAARRAGPAGFAEAWERLTRGGVPIVERVRGDRRSSLVTFVWRPERRVRAPSLYTPVGSGAEKEPGMRFLGVGGVWYLSLRLSHHARASYGFSPNPSPAAGADLKSWLRYVRTVRRDPLNPRRITFPKDPDDPKDFASTHSLLELAKAPPQPWSRDKGWFRGTEERVRTRSRYLPRFRSVWVFLPERFDPGKIRYNLLIAFDGIVYRDTVPTPRIVENLVDAGRISPTVVVLVGNAPGARTKELGGNPAFARFLARELLPWLRRRYGLTVDGSRTVLAGSSLGGVAAADAALRYPHRFGNVLAQSGAFLWFGRGGESRPLSLMEDFARAPKLPVRFYLDAGTDESQASPGQSVSLGGSVRHLRDVLEAKGYPVVYSEFEGGHDYACWRGTLADGLLHLLARPRTAGRRGRTRTG